MSYYCYIFEGTYEIDELDQAWLQLVNEKRKYKSKAYTCNATTITLSLCLFVSPSPPFSPLSLSSSISWFKWHK